MEITYSVPIHIILAGKEGVKYGKPALACALSAKIYATVTPSRIEVKDATVRQINRQVLTYLQKEKIPYHNKRYKLTFRIDEPFVKPTTYSTSFYTAAIASLLTFFTDKEFDKEVINRLAYKISDDGLVTSISTHGGLVYYRREFAFLKTISLLQFKLPKQIEKRLFVLPIKGLYYKDIYEICSPKTNQAEAWLTKLEKITKRMVVSIVKEDSIMFEQTLEDQLSLIRKIIVLPSKIPALLRVLERYGTIAIVDSYLLCFADDPHAFASYCNNNKLPIVLFTQSITGLHREK